MQKNVPLGAKIIKKVKWDQSSNSSFFSVERAHKKVYEQPSYSFEFSRAIIIDLFLYRGCVMISFLIQNHATSVVMIYVPSFANFVYEVITH